MPQFLGLDSSTQSLSAIVIDTDSGKVVLDKTIRYGQDLPTYNCPNGYIENEDPLVRHSDPLMWAEALDLLLTQARQEGFDWSNVTGISGSGQQHGSVYLNEGFAKGFGDADQASLADAVRPCLARASAPIWMDSSTSAECKEIAQAAGGNEEVAIISGSPAIERFTGPQIRKFAKEDPEGYSQTARIHLVSSFMASLVTGGDVPIDYGDGAGMNLLDLTAGTWSRKLLAATADDLKQRLPAPVPGGTQVGVVSPYLVKRYGFRVETPVFAWSGDNPCSLVGMGATQPGTAVVSLGTSDTFFGAMSAPKTDPNGYGHVFGNPAGDFMSLICFTNGSLAREAVMKKAGLNYDTFADHILKTEPGNKGNLMLPYFETETTPLVLEAGPRYFGSPDFVNGEDTAALARAIVEAQAISMRIHSRWIGESPSTIRITGGASQNAGICQVLADVFDAQLVRLEVSNSAGLGAALMAAQSATEAPWQELYATFSKPAPGTVEPQPGLKDIYAALEEQYKEKLKSCYGIGS